MLQQGMHFLPDRVYSILLMSRRPNAPYQDRVEDEGRTIIYEGHDAKRSPQLTQPKTVDQPLTSEGGRETENGMFLKAAVATKSREAPARMVRIYEKVRDGVWVFNGNFELTDGLMQQAEGRQVLKLRLELCDGQVVEGGLPDLSHNRVIPSSVKQVVWKRDQGRCVTCGANDNLHFDHVIPFSRGGSSLIPENIQLLCARHNLGKHDRIE